MLFAELDPSFHPTSAGVDLGLVLPPPQPDPIAAAPTPAPAPASPLGASPAWASRPPSRAAASPAGAAGASRVSASGGAARPSAGGNGRPATSCGTRNWVGGSPGSPASPGSVGSPGGDEKLPKVRSQPMVGKQTAPSLKQVRCMRWPGRLRTCARRCLSPPISRLRLLAAACFGSPWHGLFLPPKAWASWSHASKPPSSPHFAPRPCARASLASAHRMPHHPSASRSGPTPRPSAPRSPESPSARDAQLDRANEGEFAWQLQRHEALYRPRLRRIEGRARLLQLCRRGDWSKSLVQLACHDVLILRDLAGSRGRVGDPLQHVCP